MKQSVRNASRRKNWIYLGLGALIITGLAGCKSDDSSGDDVATETELESSLEIYSWFTAGGEKEALDSIITQFEEANPGVEVTNAAADTSTDARTELADRLESGEPPDSFQAISGVDILSYVAEGKMDAIDDIADANNWKDVFPPNLLDTVSADGKIYAVPVNIERDNNLYYNIKVLEDNAVDPPQSLDDFYAACTTLDDAGVIPLAVPAAGWVLALVAFETLMPAVNGGDYYMDFFAGDVDPQGPELEALFEELKKVLECSDIAEAQSRWDTTADLVYDGDAAMIVMGDWVKGYFEGDAYWDESSRDPWKANTDFGVVPGLGSAGYFTFNSVVFGLPSGAQHPNAAKAFLEVVGSREGQEAFNLLKGSVPARTDVDLSAFDDMVRGAAEDLATAGEGTNKLLPGYASSSTFDFQVEINPSLLVFAVGGTRARELDPDNVAADEEMVPALDVDYIVSKISANYGLLKE